MDNPEPLEITLEPIQCELCKVRAVSSEQISKLWTHLDLQTGEFFYFCGKPHLEDWKRERYVR